MNEEVKNTYSLYPCKECGLHYEKKEIAEKCEQWCAAHKSCNVEITTQSQEHKVIELEKQREEYLNNWKRASADMANYKKEEMERMAMLGNYAKESIIHRVLPIFDSFYLAEKHAHILENVSMAEWQKGFTQIENQISEFLKKEGIETIETVGQKFNAEIMDIVEEVEPASAESSGVVTEELQKGYKIGEKVVRAAKVKISK